MFGVVCCVSMLPLSFSFLDILTIHVFMVVVGEEFADYIAEPQFRVLSIINIISTGTEKCA